MSAGTPFHDLADFVAAPRVTALRLAPDGSWLAAAVQTLSTDKKRYLTSIWRIDAQGGPARRLTAGSAGAGPVIEPCPRGQESPCGVWSELRLIDLTGERL